MMNFNFKMLGAIEVIGGGFILELCTDEKTQVRCAPGMEEATEIFSCNKGGYHLAVQIF